MTHKEPVPPAESKPSPTESQFSVVTDELWGVLQRHSDYYEKDQITDILDKFSKAQTSFEKDEIPADQVIKVNIFGGLQSRNEGQGYERERKANRVVEDLYLSLNRLAGYHPANYFDIKKDASDLAAQHLIVNKEIDATTNYLKSAQVGDRVAIVENGEHEPVGIKIKISDNILATFVLGNIGNPEDTGHMTFVDLIVVPEQ